MHALDDLISVFVTPFARFDTFIKNPFTFVVFCAFNTHAYISPLHITRSCTPHAFTSHYIILSFCFLALVFDFFFFCPFFMRFFFEYILYAMPVFYVLSFNRNDSDDLFFAIAIGAWMNDGLPGVSFPRRRRIAL